MTSMISAEEERGYLERRRDWHRHMAERSGTGALRTLHERFATLYADRARAQVG